MAENPPRPTAIRPFWSGTLTFGLVSVPVELFTAVRRQSVSLRMVGPQGRPVERRYVSSKDGRTLEADAIVRGIDVDGTWVTVTDDELEALEPDKTREIDLQRFVTRDAIDPMYCDRPYLLLPDGEVTKAYRLLAAVMEESGLAGVASFVLRGREYLVAIFADDGVLRAETLRRDDEVRSVADVGLPALVASDPARVKTMRQVIDDQLEEALPLAELTDDRSRRLRELAAAKPAKSTVPAEVHEGSGNVVDIMDVLKQRLGVQERSAS